MPIFSIEDSAARWMGTVNSAPTAVAAIAQHVAEALEPRYCRCHAEIARFHTAPVGEMGYYYPQRRTLPQPARAVRMREIYMSGGYCLVPAEPARCVS